MKSNVRPSSRPPIVALIVDLGGVLLTNGWDSRSRKKAISVFQLEEKELEKRHQLVFDIYERGKMTLDEYLDAVVFYAPRAFSRQAFKDFMLSRSQPFEEMLDLIGSLKERHGFKIGSITNEGRELLEYRIRSFHLNKRIDFFVGSCFVQCRKPEATIFQLALDLIAVPAPQILYIDDRELHVEAAQKLGMKGILHKALETTKEEIYALTECPAAL